MRTPGKRSKKVSKKEQQSNKRQKVETDGATGSEGAEGKVKERFEVFYGSECVFSQFHPCKFKVDDKEYCCMEQYMHHQKAVIFKDDMHANEIMNTEEPRKHKSLGRKVENFEKDVWSEKSKEVVKKGNLEKYRQNPELKQVLLDTYPRTLVEASPRDRLWGIGLGPKNPDAHDRSKWRGKNQLGQILTEVRDILREEEEKSTSS